MPESKKYFFGLTIQQDRIRSDTRWPRLTSWNLWYLSWKQPNPSQWEQSNFKGDLLCFLFFLYLFSFPSVCYIGFQRSQKLKSPKSAPIHLSNWKHCLWNVVNSLTFNSVTLWHHATSLWHTVAAFMPISTENRTETETWWAALAHACVNWPIRAGWEFQLIHDESVKGTAKTVTLKIINNLF